MTPLDTIHYGYPAREIELLIFGRVVPFKKLPVDIFEPYEIEIKTGRTKYELIARFKRRARIEGDRFYIDSEPFGIISRSTVVGHITDTADWTIVSFKIYALAFLKVLSYLWLGGVGVATLASVIKALTNLTYSSEIHWMLVFWAVGFIISQLAFRTSADIQEESIRQMIREKE